MAWQAHVDSIIVANFDTQSITMNVSYWDDAVLDPNTQLPVVQATKSFAFPPSTSTATVRADVVATGQRIRASAQRQAALQSFVGTSIPIP